MSSEAESDDELEGMPPKRDRRSPRMLRCDIVDSLGRTHACVLKNISRRGIGGSGCHLLVGQPVTVLLPGLGLVTGSVRWSADGKFGIRLDYEVNPAAITFVPGTNPKEAEQPKFEVSPWHHPSADWRRPGFRGA